MLRFLLASTMALLATRTAWSETTGVLSVPPDTTRWSLAGKAEVTEYEGRPCLHLDGGEATVRDLELRDGVIDVDVTTPASRGFFGIEFRMASDDQNAEWVYLRQHRSGYPDAIQYTPILNTGLNWQLYNGPGFTAAVEIPKNQWFHLRLELTGAQAKFYVSDMTQPALVMDDLKSGVEKGGVGLAVLTGATYFSTSRFAPCRTRPGSGISRRCRQAP
jgi:hypothetical protein